MFSAYELNPVAQTAQEHVAIPEGLDLDAWIVPSEAAAADKLVAEPEEPRVRKNKKGKEKEVNGKSRKGKKKPNDGVDVVSSSVAPEVEVAEDNAADVERVRIFTTRGLQ